MSYLICLLLTGAGSKRTFSLLNGESAVVLCCVVLCWEEADNNDSDDD
jgi:type IV secretory pathway TrbD component